MNDPDERASESAAETTGDTARNTRSEKSERLNLEVAVAQLKRRERQTAVLAELGRAALTADNLDMVLSQAVSQIADTLDCPLCKVLKLEPDGSLLMVAGVGWRTGLLGKARVGGGTDSQAGFTLQACEPVIVDDLRKEERFSGPLLLVEHGVVSGMSVCIGPEDGPWGVLGCHTTEQRRFSSDDAYFIQAVSNTLWDAISRRNIEDLLRQSEERFRMVADNMDQLAWTCDDLGNVTWYNKRWHEYTGLSLDDTKGWKWSAVQHPDHLSRVVAKVRESAETGEPWEDTFPLLGKDGEYRWFLSRALPIRDSSGCIVRWFGTNTDVTEQRNAEDALREADRRKDDFLATLAHELRNPLAPIRSAAEVIRQKDHQDSELLWAQEVIERQVVHMTRLIDDLLDVSRIARNKLTLRKRPVSIADIVQAAVESSAQAIARAGHELDVSLPPDPVYLRGDLVRLSQVLTNLLNNASKFTERGGRIKLSVEQMTSEAKASQIVIRVADTGIGIAEDELPRLFDRFFQVDDLRNAQGGLGLGLSLVKLLTNMHGGSVEALSDGPGKGSEFIVRLPAIENTVASANEDDAATPMGPLEARTILVVDDNRDAADAMSRMLQMIGLDVHTAYNGKDAITVAARVRPQITLLDVRMPGMSGIETCRQIRNESWGKDIRIIALTGLAQAEDRRQTNEAGFDAHLAKPVDPVSLKMMLSM